VGLRDVDTRERSGTDKEGSLTMSSMRGVALILLLVTSTAGSTQTSSTATAQTAAVAAPTYGYSVGYALNDWRRLRQSSGYTFADYARFLIEASGLGREGDAARREFRGRAVLLLE